MDNKFKIVKEIEEKAHLVIGKNMLPSMNTEPEMSINQQCAISPRQYKMSFACFFK